MSRFGMGMVIFKDMVEKIHGIVISISLSHDFGKKENHQVKLLRLVFLETKPINFLFIRWSYSGM